MKERPHADVEVNAATVYQLYISLAICCKKKGVIIVCTFESSNSVYCQIPCKVTLCPERRLPLQDSNRNSFSEVKAKSFSRKTGF